MTREQAVEIARHWVESWNARDLEAVLTHFDDEARFVSPKAATLTGNAVVRGKAALRSYWQLALSRIGSLRFALESVLWDGERRTMTIVYRREIDAQSDRACEFLRFGDSGRAVDGEAMYGASV